VILFKADYILGIILNDVLSSVLLLAVLIYVVFGIAGIYIVLRRNDQVLKILLTTAFVDCTVWIWGFFTFLAEFESLRKKAFLKSVRNSKSKMMKLICRGCRVSSVRLGPFCEVDKMFAPLLITITLNQLVTVLKAFPE